MFQNRTQTHTGDFMRHLHAANVGNCGKEIDEFNERTARLASLHARRSDHERGSAGSLEKRVFVPPESLAGVVAVIADEDDKRLVPEFVFVECIEYSTELCIHKTCTSTVRAEQLSPFLLGEFGERLAKCTEPHRVLARRCHVCGIAPGFQ